MGVRGLMTYMRKETRSLKPFKLRNTIVVLDGNNLLHSIHLAHNLTWQFGGEYGAFDKALVKFFERFQECDLEPFVVFDGCYDAEGIKFQTTLSRFKERLMTLSRLNNQFSTHGFLLPMLAIQTMITVLNRLNIRYVTCHEEADKEAAALANYFNCPVISNDSDFFIYPLNYGFIPVEDLNFIPSEENCDCCPMKHHNFLSCLLFNQNGFQFKEHTNSFHLKPLFFPLFATVLGNDFASKTLFENVYNHLKQLFRTGYSKKLQNNSSISNLLNWLNEFDDIESVMKKLLTLIRLKDRCFVEKVLKQSLQQYDLSNTNSKLVDVVACSSNKTKLLSVENSILVQLPDHIANRMNEYILSPILLNSLISRRVFLNSFVESIQKPSIHEPSKPIRDNFYQELFSNVISQSEEISVTEYFRKEKSILKRQIPISNISSSFSIVTQKFDNRFSFIKQLIIIWIQLTEHQFLSGIDVLALISSIYIQYSWQQELSKSISSTFRKDQYSHKAFKFFREPTISKTNKFQIEVVHLFNELQSIYFYLSQLLALRLDFCGASLSAPQMIFCGKLFYNLSMDLKKRKKCWNYLIELFNLFPCSNFRLEFESTVKDVANIWPKLRSAIGLPDEL